MSCAIQSSIALCAPDKRGGIVLCPDEESGKGKGCEKLSVSLTEHMIYNPPLIGFTCYSHYMFYPYYPCVPPTIGSKLL